MIIVVYLRLLGDEWYKRSDVSVYPETIIDF